MWRFKSFQPGFTLVELLVVLVLMGLGLSLVGPATIQRVERVRAEAEFGALQDALRRQSFLAFAQGGPRELVLRGEYLSVRKPGSQERDAEMRFEFLRFPAQVVMLNQNGYPEPEMLELVVGERSRELNLFRLVEGLE